MPERTEAEKKRSPTPTGAEKHRPTERWQTAAGRPERAGDRGEVRDLLGDFSEQTGALFG